ncbi:hypothetical protein DL765_004059 [Monosporascus sp. GIB2]|nr:hypothetical protein DL765_004059 [Monosporascus sp. GIB2]
MQSLLEHIPFETLPKTFQDAVIVTRYLGFRYLWIDAICILQDSAQDWLEEAPTMATVYRNSACTIAAHTSKGETDGFLAATFASPEPTLRIINGGHEYRVALASNFRDQVLKSFLSRRGWVFQERTLSRRIIHFVQNHLFFEDDRGVKASDVRGGKGNPLVYSFWQDPKIDIKEVFSTPADWYRMVERYSTCLLTFDSDRLPAIEGIAQYAKAQGICAAYLFGLWRESLHQGLLWLEISTVPETLSQGSSLPSWSWARWKGEIKFPDYLSGFEPLFEIESGFGMHEASPPPVSVDMGLLSLTLEVVDIFDVKAIPFGRATGRGSFRREIPGLYMVESPTITGLEWAAFDGKRRDHLFFPKLSCAFIARHVGKKHWYNEEKEVVETHLNRRDYVLLLKETDHDAQRAVKRMVKIE